MERCILAAITTWKIDGCYYQKSCNKPEKSADTKYSVYLYEEGKRKNAYTPVFEYKILEPLLSILKLSDIKDLAGKTFQPSKEEKNGEKAFVQYLVDQGIDPGKQINKVMSQAIKQPNLKNWHELVDVPRSQCQSPDICKTFDVLGPGRCQSICGSISRKQG